MKICLVSSYPLRQCGIATFSYNLLSSIQAGTGHSKKINSFVVALNDCDEKYAYPEEVEFTIQQNVQQDYIKAAEYINSNADVCLLQHEYGIFGGNHGLYILSLLNRLTIPFITTLHTVLKEPSFLQKTILQQIARKSSKVIVMTRLAIKFLKTIYDIPEEKIALIEHGVPELAGTAHMQKELLPFTDKRILFTFGLLSKNKGIETVIRALPEVVKNHPDIMYIVLGKTHPAVLRHCGEEYRNHLKQLAEELHVDKHIHFIDKFMNDEELFTYLKSVDIYITPYMNETQITSGTLSYAIGAGAVVVSTPYWHAQELLANDRGRLFQFKDAEALSDVLNELLDDPVQMENIKKKAFQYGQHLRWPLIGSRYADIAAEAMQYYQQPKREVEYLLNENNLPPFTLAYLKRLTDDTGVIQHAKYGIPNWKEGYCLDDNARALITALMAHQQLNDKHAIELMPTYLSFIHYMQRDDGTFGNFLHYNRTYLDEVGSQDAFGRTIWALGYLIRYAPNNSYKEFGIELFSRSYPQFTQLTSLRGIADTIIGICHYLKAIPTDEGVLQTLIQLTKKLTDEYELHHSKNWNWFENELIYDNGILPLALLHSYEITGNVLVKNIALQTINFLETKTLSKGYFTPIGNQGWHQKNGKVPLFDQQAIEVMAIVFMYQEAYQVTKDSQYIKHLNICFSWFLGNNELHVPLYDHETNGCCDGLECTGINRNQGAESTLAYLTSYLVVLKTKTWQYESEKKKINMLTKNELMAV